MSAEAVSIGEASWFGDGTDEVAEYEAAKSVAALVAKMNGIRPFPIAARQLMEAARDPDAKVGDIAKILENDSALATRVLRLVNSAAFGPRRVPCKSIHHAVVLLGAINVGALASTGAVFDIVGDSSPDAMRVLAHSAAVAAVARRLSYVCNLSPDDVFTCGLLHDIGKLMLLQAGDPEYAALLRANSDVADGMFVAEREKYGFDHGVLAAHMLTVWKIPKPVPQVIAWHHQVSRAYGVSPQVTAMVHLLRLANQIVLTLDRAGAAFATLARPSAETIAAAAAVESATYLELSNATLSGLWGELVRVYLASKDILVDEAEATPRDEDGEPTSGIIRIEPPEPVGASCYVCGDSTFGQTCARCGIDACSRHAPRGHEVCSKCEEEFTPLRASLERKAPSKASIGAVAAVGVAVLMSVLFADERFANVLTVAAASLVGLALAMGAYGVRLRWVVRGRFLADRIVRAHSVAP